MNPYLDHVPTMTISDSGDHYTVRCACDWGSARYPTPINDEWKAPFLRHMIDEMADTIDELRSALGAPANE